MTPYSVLDLSPIPEGSTAGEALRNSGDLARHAEALGYKRYWMAEHHNMTGIASAATAVALGYVAGQTKTIRVGAGGVMLPNHAPLVIAEQFGTLASLYPNRVDLGLGRAPGTDQMTARALRRSLDNSDNFPQDVVELMAYLEAPEPNQRIRAVPGAGTNVPIWILGSSMFGAQLAAHLGLPYAFASHFAPGALSQALEVYRETYRPSERWPRPHFMLAINVFAADSEDEARLIKTSMSQAFVNLRTGRPGPLPRPMADFENQFDPIARSMVDQALAVSATGTPQTVRAQLSKLIETHRPDEVILTGQIHDHAARKRSFAIAADAMRDLTGMRQAAE